MFCPYCGEEKPDSEKSDEHVLPKAIGGNLEPANPFKLVVCQRCNSLAGRHVDGPFIRSFFVNANRFNAIRYTKLSRNSVLPLTYMGELKNSPLKNKICEVWMGPTGDTIYHFHDPYPEIEGSQITVGPPLNLREEAIDTGFAFFFARATNPFWHPIVLNSFADQFKRAILYSGNVQLSGKWRFSDIPKELLDVHQTLLHMSGQSLEIEMPIYPHCDKRFLAKLALGFGVLFLKKAFIYSRDARSLRRIMWTKSPSELEKAGDRIISVLDGRLQELKDMTSWKPGHVFVVLPDSNDVLNLFAVFYGESPAAVKISHDSILWGDKIINEGFVFVVAPGLRHCVGPVSFDDYSEAKQGHFNDRTQGLADLFKTVENLPPPPPYDI